MGRAQPGSRFWPFAPSARRTTPSRRRPGGRRFHARARRNLPGPQRRALPRRAPRVQSPHAGSAPAAAGRRHSDDRPGLVEHHLPGQFHADRRLEPLPLRLPRRFPAEFATARRRSRSTCEDSGRWWIASTCTSKCRPCRSASFPAVRRALPARRCGGGGRRAATQAERFHGARRGYNADMAIARSGILQAGR